jgi:hypothetical protein
MSFHTGRCITDVLKKVIERRNVVVLFVFLICHILSSVLGSETRYPEQDISRFPSLSSRNAGSALYSKLSLIPSLGLTQNNHVN